MARARQRRQDIGRFQAILARQGTEQMTHVTHGVPIWVRRNERPRAGKYARGRE